MLLTLLTDFGLQDEWVGVLKGVVLAINPRLKILDISHDIPSYNVIKGAFVLSAALPYMPPGVHLAIVDPGVGTNRRALVTQTERGDYLVGPDNGILIPAAESLGGITEVIEIENELYFQKPVSPTFNGRDIFAPVAAHLTQGVEIKEFGPALDAESLIRPAWRPLEIHSHMIKMQIIDIDKFGTVRFNIRNEDWYRVKPSTTSEFELKARRLEIEVPFVTSFGEVAAGVPLLFADSSGYLGLAINRGDAAEHWDLHTGQDVRISWRQSE